MLRNTLAVSKKVVSISRNHPVVVVAVSGRVRQCYFSVYFTTYTHIAMCRQRLKSPNSVLTQLKKIKTRDSCNKLTDNNGRGGPGGGRGGGRIDFKKIDMC